MISIRDMFLTLSLPIAFDYLSYCSLVLTSKRTGGGSRKEVPTCLVWETSMLVGPQTCFTLPCHALDSQL
jgi:hypothetical protein